VAPSSGYVTFLGVIAFKREEDFLINEEADEVTRFNEERLFKRVCDFDDWGGMGKF
jgi:hypothetical protein